MAEGQEQLDGFPGVETEPNIDNRTTGVGRVLVATTVAVTLLSCFPNDRDAEGTNGPAGIESVIEGNEAAFGRVSFVVTNEGLVMSGYSQVGGNIDVNVYTGEGGLLTTQRFAISPDKDYRFVLADPEDLEAGGTRVEIEDDKGNKKFWSYKG